MTEEATETGAREVGNPAMHSDDGPTNRNPELPAENDPETPGLGQHGNAAQHEPGFSQIQGSSQASSGGTRMAEDTTEPVE